MNILGIHFEPLNTPMKCHIETISAALAFTGNTFLLGIGTTFNLFIFIYTSFWTILLIYFAWIWIDIPTTKKGGRRSEWVRGWKLFKYAADYYPITLTISPELKLDPKRNYIIAGHPHGVFPNGSTIGLCTKALGIEKVFPNHTIFALTLDINLKVPYYRDFLMALGMCSVSEESFNYILQNPRGGNIALMAVGGAAESYLSVPGSTEIVLKNRKGFVKMAIKNGSPLIPLYSFGEVDVFNQYIAPKNTKIQLFQNWIKNVTGISLPLFYGRGIFQKSFGLFPHRKPINVVVGKAIDVIKNENPSRDEVEALHKVFVDEITKLFEEYKYNHFKDAKNKYLIILYLIILSSFKHY